MEAKVLSVNCQGLGSNEKRLDIFNYLKSKNCQIYCLQDTHFTTKNEKFIRAQWGFDCIFSSGTSNSRGVAILFYKDIEYTVHKHLSSPDGNYILVDITLEGHRITLVNIYGPNSDSPEFFENIIVLANSFNNDKLIWCGDFNVVQNPSIDCYNYIHLNNKKAHEKIARIKDDHFLIDPFREYSPTTKRYTWRKKTPLKQARLDYFLISDNLLPSVNSCKIENSYRSDHSMISLEIKFNPFIKGKPLWKHNNALLHDAEYLKVINDKITDIKMQYALPVYNRDNIEQISDNEIQFVINDQLFLDTLLMEIRGKSISYASFKKKENTNRENELIKIINNLEQNLEPENVEALESLQEELKQIRKIKMQGYLLRSRANIIEYDEKPTKFFCSLESHNFTSKIIPKIEKEDGKLITDQHEILEEAKHFYQKLYSSRDQSLNQVDLEDELKQYTIPKLNLSESNSLEGQITIDEAAQALKSMKNNRSPGSDGFGADFFKAFWGRLGYFIVRAINYGYEHGELSTTQKEGVITCIPKDNKPRQFLKNYRPISLLNCVYKIASSTIANRLKTVLPKLIHEDQTGFIKGRYLGENTRQIYDIMHFAEENNIEGLLLLVDFEKAFDSVSWNFITEVLKFFKFGKSFISWIHLFYKNAKLCINQGGNLSTFYQIERGCRQWDPISPYIFILCAEILAVNIRNNGNIKGIKVGHTEFKFSQYADDSSVILDGTSISLNETLKELSRFADISGLNVNFDKTQVVWIGKKKYSSDTIKTRWKLKWGVTQFKLLGVNFDVDLDKVIDINYSGKITQLKRIIQIWKRRYLTPLGKISVIKSLLLPLFNHLFISLPNPNSGIIKQINSLLYEFLWEGPAKIKNSIVVKEYLDGGLKMVNLVAFIRSLKTTWIRRLIISPGKWNKIIQETVNFKNIFQFGDAFLDITKQQVTNKFWIDVFETFKQLLNKNTPKVAEDFLATPLFHNTSIRIGGSPVYLKHWHTKGIFLIADIVNTNGEFFSLTQLQQLFQINSNFLEYHGLIASLKKFKNASNIKEILHRREYPIIPSTIALITKSTKGTKEFYNIFNANTDIPTSKSKWKNLYDIDQMTWSEIYLSPFRSTNSTALQWFQIRINHNILPTKKYLYKIKATVDPFCHTCKEEENITHLLWSCPATQTFLKQIQDYLQRNGITHKFTERSFIFNIDCLSAEELNFNLKLKQYIFVNKYHKKPLSYIAAINKIKYQYEPLKHIAFRNNKIDSFMKKWDKYANILEI